MAAANETEPTNTVDESATESDQESRLRRYDQRIEEWLTSLKEGAEQRSPEVLSALATKAKDVGDYLDKLADKARSRAEPSATTPDTRESLGAVSAHGDQGQGELGYRGPDPESDPKGDGDHEDQGT
jgi:hypothetical protein